MYLASSITLGGLLCIYYMIPGKNFNSKCDHYLRLDGLVVAGMKFVLLPGRSFFKSKNFSFVYCCLLLFVIVWGYGSEFGRPLSKSFKQVEVEEGVGQEKLDSLKAASLTKVDPLPKREVKVGWNLKGQTKAISAIAQDIKMDKMFFIDNWIQSLPFEWQLK